MAFFAIGNMLLKIRRERPPRDVRAGWPTVSFAFIAVILGVIGNIYLDPTGVSVFASYFLIFGGAVVVMFVRVEILKALLFIARNALSRVKIASERIHAQLN